MIDDEIAKVIKSEGIDCIAKLNKIFEIIDKNKKEEQERRINIQDIPEFEPTLPIDNDTLVLVGILNRLVKAVKQLDKDVNGDGRY